MVDVNTSDGWFECLVDEAAELTKKIRKLREFRRNTAFSVDDAWVKELLDQQYVSMRAYCAVLNERIGLEIDSGE